MSVLAFWYCFVLFLGRFIWFCKSGVAKHIKKKHCLGNSYVEKSIIFGFLGIHWTSCTYFNNCVLGDFNWAGPVGWAKTRSKTSQKKTIGLIAHIWHKLTNHRDYVPISNQFFWMSRPKVIKKSCYCDVQKYYELPSGEHHFENHVLSWYLCISNLYIAGSVCSRRYRNRQRIWLVALHRFSVLL